MLFVFRKSKSEDILSRSGKLMVRLIYIGLWLTISLIVRRQIIHLYLYISLPSSLAFKFGEVYYYM